MSGTHGRERAPNPNTDVICELWLAVARTCNALGIEAAKAPACVTLVLADSGWQLIVNAHDTIKPHTLASQLGDVDLIVRPFRVLLVYERAVVGVVTPYAGAVRAGLPRETEAMLLAMLKQQEDAARHPH